MGFCESTGVPFAQVAGIAAWLWRDDRAGMVTRNENRSNAVMFGSVGSHEWSIGFQWNSVNQSCSGWPVREYPCPPYPDGHANPPSAVQRVWWGRNQCEQQPTTAEISVESEAQRARNDASWNTRLMAASHSVGSSSSRRFGNNACSNCGQVSNRFNPNNVKVDQVPWFNSTSIYTDQRHFGPTLCSVASTYWDWAFLRSSSCSASDRPDVQDRRALA